jgi:diguanylate cyclase (GGDEF)-like protein/PAS domain S-box-containing protein
MTAMPPESSTSRPAGRLARAMAAHFHDYSSSAMRLWLLVFAAGAVSLVAALAALGSASPAVRLQAVLGLILVAVAAWFPVQIPRTKYSIGPADAFIFTMLAMLGPAAAVLASGLEGVIGAWRGTKRLSSRLSTPAAGMAAMTVCGWVFQAFAGSLVHAGLSVPVANAAALLPASLVPFALTTLTLTSLVTLKRHAWPNLREWFSNLGWVAALYLVAALVAGVVQLNAAQYGPAVLGVVAVAALVVVLLLRVSVAHQEAEHHAQEVRISEAQREAEQNQQRFAAAFTHAAIGMAIVDASGAIVRVNEALSGLLGRNEATLLGQPFASLFHSSDATLFERRSREVAERQGAASFSIELRCMHAEGRELWVALHCGHFEEPDGNRQGLIYQLHDITSRQVAERRLQHIAYHDNLTDLPNRASFHEQLALAVEASRERPDAAFAVMFLDLDRFKIVNDSLGHLHGNELLRAVAQRLQQCVGPHDLVARLGGDEFAVLVRHAHDAPDGLHLAGRMLAALAVPLTVGGTELTPSASIGLTRSDLGYRTVDELLRDADLAMYEAKASGRNRVVVFDRTMHERIADKLALEADLRKAIGAGTLSLTFQPFYGLETQQVVGVEALARWMHPSRGPISPEVFIALAEEAGHIGALTRWVIGKSVDYLASWGSRAAELRMNVNISGRDLVQPGFVDGVLDVLHAHGVSPERLTLEITETVLMQELELARAALAQLRAGGVRVAIDDFGTGYSSLAYLRTLPIDYLKIDRSFVSAMDSGEENVEVVRAVTMLGRALSKQVVAEGIETPAQLATLRRLGVLLGQGYLLSRPLKPAQVAALLDAPAAPLRVVEASEPL